MTVARRLRRILKFLRQNAPLETFSHERHSADHLPVVRITLPVADEAYSAELARDLEGHDLAGVGRTWIRGTSVFAAAEGIESELLAHVLGDLPAGSRIAIHRFGAPPLHFEVR